MSWRLIVRLEQPIRYSTMAWMRRRQCSSLKTGGARGNRLKQEVG
jgi:hypothetical protein